VNGTGRSEPQQERGKKPPFKKKGKEKFGNGVKNR
jgi:hypothetical protein